MNTITHFNFRPDYDDADADSSSLYYLDNDDEHLNPGTYLIPVKDPLFTVRLRQYRRDRYERIKQIESTLIYKQKRDEQRSEKKEASIQRELSSSIQTSKSIHDLQDKQPTPDPQQQQQLRQRNSISKLTDIQPSFFTQKPIKERYQIDVYGRCVYRGSLSRQSVVHRRSSQSKSLMPNSLSSTENNLNTLVDQKDDRRTASVHGEGQSPLIREKLKDTHLIVGERVVFRCRVEGNPAPHCYWYHNDRLIIGDDDRYSISQSEDGVNTLSIYKARCNDVGVYRCTARNQYGTVLTSARLRVGDTPDRPSKPICVHFTSNEAYLVWEAPVFNGNSDILSFKVDYKVSDDVKWSNALYTIQECCLIKSLAPHTKYRFRVSCINAVGVSPYSWASDEVQTLDQNTTVSQKQKTNLIVDCEKIDYTIADSQFNFKLKQDQSQMKQQQQQQQQDLSALSSSKKKNFEVKSGSSPYELGSLITESNGVKLFESIDKKFIIKKAKKQLNQNEIDLLTKFNEHDRLFSLMNVFMNTSSSNEYTFIYENANDNSNAPLPLLDFISLKHKYSEELVVNVLRQVLDGVQWIHLHGYAHLNLHPLTIFNANMTHVNVKLCGFDNMIELASSANKSKLSAASSSITAIDFSGMNSIKFYIVSFFLLSNFTSCDLKSR